MKTLLLSLLLLLCVGCQTQTTPENTLPPGCSLEEPCETEKVNASANLIWDKISFEEAMEHFEDESVILFYSFEDCPYCVEARPLLEEATKDQGVTVYYVDVLRDQRETGNDIYDQTYAHFKEVIQEEKMYLPFVGFIKNGEVVFGHTGTVDGHMPKEAKMTDGQKEELKTIYREGLTSMK